jgi:chitodextrinase
VLEQGGTPVQNGTTVTFTTNLGALSPQDARTLNGVATVQFLGNGQSGKASIKAISGGAASEALEISVGAGAAGRVNLTANPTSVSAAGGSTTITAQVSDASGNALSGVPVTFSTTTGSFSAQVVNTDSTGRASTTLTTSREASVTATAGGTTSAAITITVSPGPTASISVAAGTTPVEGAITTFSITVNAATGGAPIQNVRVDYDDGSSDDLGSVSGTVSVQHVYGSDGTYTPRLTATDAIGNSTTASTVIVVQPLLVSITASATTNPKVINFTANVSPAGVPVASYAWTFGDGTSATTSGATTSHTYAAAGDRTVRVTIRTTTNRTATGSTNITVQ